MKSKKILAVGLAVSMMASMVIGVSASSTEIRIGAEGDTVPSSGSANVAIEGIIEPTENTSSSDMINPTDPSGETEVTSWEDPLVNDTSQLLVTAPTKMKFVVRGNGTAYGAASLVGAETVSGTVRNASAYIPAADGTVKPKTVTVAVSSITTNGAPEFNLLAAAATQSQMETFGTLKGSVQGLDIQLNSNSAIDFATANATTLGDLEKGSLTSNNEVKPSSNTIAFKENGMKTAFVEGQDGRLVNNYTMGLTFTYIQ